MYDPNNKAEKKFKYNKINKSSDHLSPSLKIFVIIRLSSSEIVLFRVEWLEMVARKAIIIWKKNNKDTSIHKKSYYTNSLRDRPAMMKRLVTLLQVVIGFHHFQMQHLF